jgi:hypothetical protein
VWDVGLLSAPKVLLLFLDRAESGSSYELGLPWRDRAMLRSSLHRLTLSLCSIDLCDINVLVLNY